LHIQIHFLKKAAIDILLNSKDMMVQYVHNSSLQTNIIENHQYQCQSPLHSAVIHSIMHPRRLQIEGIVFLFLSKAIILYCLFIPKIEECNI